MRPANRGISVDQMTSLTVKRNGIYSAGEVGIYVYRSTDVGLYNNSVIGSRQHGVQFTSSSGRVSNNILGENTRYGISISGTVPSCTYNDLYSNSTGDYQGVAEGRGDIHAAPMLTDPAAGDFHPPADSPVVDRGDPTLEMDPDGTTADIGMWFFNHNHRPAIQNWTPQDSVFQYPGDSLLIFSLQATDPDNDALFYEWTVNGVVEERRGNIFRRTFNRDGSYWVRVVVTDQLYEGTQEHSWRVNIVGSGVGEELTLPTGYAVSEIYPNPFNGQSKLDLTLPVTGKIAVEVWDISGRLTATLFQGDLAAGNHSVVLNADGLATGRYFLVTRLGGSRAVRSFVLLR